MAVDADEGVSREAPETANQRIEEHVCTAEIGTVCLTYDFVIGEFANGSQFKR